MLTYTFTTREKVLIAIAAVLFGGLAWYYFIFATVQLRMDALGSQISTTQEEISLATNKVAELQLMKAEIEQFKAEGRSAVQMPSYDNIKAIMDMLNATIGVGQFKLTSDDLNVETAGVVKRGITIEFRAQSYEAARHILDSIAEGPYPCSVESVSMSDESARRGSTDENPFVTNAHITFYEEDVDGIFASYAVSEE